MPKKLRFDALCRCEQWDVTALATHSEGVQGARGLSLMPKKLRFDQGKKADQTKTARA